MNDRQKEKADLPQPRPDSDGFPRAILRRVRLAPDDWWQAWDDPDTDARSTDWDSLAEMSGAESLTTTTMTCPVTPSFFFFVGSQSEFPVS